MTDQETAVRIVRQYAYRVDDPGERSMLEGIIAKALNHVRFEAKERFAKMAEEVFSDTPCASLGNTLAHRIRAKE